MNARRPDSPLNGFPRQRRLTRKAEFELVLRQGVRCAAGPLVLWAHPNALGITRLGLIVARRHGGAVQRNRLKRVLREAFRLGWRELPQGWDLVCSPHPGVTFTRAGAIECLRQLGGRAARRWRHRTLGAVAPPEPDSGPQP